MFWWVVTPTLTLTTPTPQMGESTECSTRQGLATSASLVCGEAIDLDSQKSPTICRMIALSMIEVLR